MSDALGPKLEYDEHSREIVGEIIKGPNSYLYGVLVGYSDLRVYRPLKGMTFVDIDERFGMSSGIHLDNNAVEQLIQTLKEVKGEMMSDRTITITDAVQVRMTPRERFENTCIEVSSGNPADTEDDHTVRLALGLGKGEKTTGVFLGYDDVKKLRAFLDWWLSVHPLEIGHLPKDAPPTTG